LACCCSALLACRLATYDGEIIFHSPSGALLPQKLVIPKLSVHKARSLHSCV
jgi:hypothetical protein